MLTVRSLKLLNGVTVSLDLPAGKTSVLTGPNGIGKSVLLRTLALLHPTSFVSYQFDGQDVDQLSPQQFRSQVLYVPPVPLDTQGSVADFFQWPFSLTAFQKHTRDFKFSEELKRENFWERDMANLSSGEKQYVQILRAFEISPQVLLLDEVMGHMDQTRVLRIEQILAEMDKTVLMVTHQEAQWRRIGAHQIEFQQLVQNY